MQEFDLNIGAHIRFQDGSSGSLRKVVVDPQTKRVTDLVVSNGLLQRHEYVVPVSCVEQATAEIISVTLSLQELANYPEYRQIEFDEPLPDWEAGESYAREHVQVWYPSIGVIAGERGVVPAIRRRVAKGIRENEEVIGRASVVRNLDGVVGKVDHLLLDRGSWEITHLVVRRGLIPHFVVVPYAWVNGIGPEGVFVRGSNSQLREVPIARWQQEMVARGAGVGSEEENALDVNLALAEDVIALLAEDPRTALYPIEVVCEQGMVTLLGDVGDMTAHTAAEEIAHRHAQVKSVVNALEVRAVPDTITAVSSSFGQLMEHAFIFQSQKGERDANDY